MAKSKFKFTLAASAGLFTALLFAAGAWRNETKTAGLIFSKSEKQSLQTASSSARNDNSNAAQKSSLPSNSVLQAALRDADSSTRKDLLQQWADSIDLNAMGDTLEGTQSLGDDALKIEVRTALLNSWCKRNLDGAITWFSKRGGADGLHEQARDRIAEAMAKEDPASVLNWMNESVPVTSRNELYLPLCREWMRRSPAETATMVRTMIGQKSMDPSAALILIDFAGQVAAQWSNTDVNSAVSWAQSLSQGAARNRALEQLSDKWTMTNPQAAAADALKENDPQLLRNVAAKWAEIDPGAAAAWARQLPAGKAGTEAIVSLMPTWTQRDPQAAADFIADLPSGDAQNEAAVSAVSAWAYTAPAEAAQWVSDFPEGSARNLAMKQLVGTWAGNDANQVAQWIKALPQTPSRDYAVDAYSGAVTSSSPGAAFAWAQTISDQALRVDRLQSVVKVWLQNDATTAQQEITQANLPADLKEQLLSGANL
jgi:hypothetical protein